MDRLVVLVAHEELLHGTWEETIIRSILIRNEKKTESDPYKARVESTRCHRWNNKSIESFKKR